MINQKKPKFKELVGIGLIFLTGIIVEYLGVNYNLIFGEYEYGKNMGPDFERFPYSGTQISIPDRPSLPAINSKSMGTNIGNQRSLVVKFP